MTRILCLHYSQSGQLKRIAQQFCKPLEENSEIDLTCLNIKPKQDLPFPWPFVTFFNTFPETVYSDPIELTPLPLTDEELKHFDLVILAYQVWFLSPSLPIASFLQSEQAKILFYNTPTITLIGCRNMWLMAQETMKSQLKKLQAKHIDNIVLIDEVSTAMSFISTPLWMFTGKQGPWGNIPKAGVAAQDIEACDRFGKVINKAIASNQTLDQSLLTGTGAVRVNTSHILSEKMAKRGFMIWGKLIRLTGKHAPILRKPLVCLYVVYLLVIILTLVPLIAILKKILSPFIRKRIQAQKHYYSAPSGEGTENLENL